MATLLSLVNDVERESGTVASTQRLASVTGAIGQQEKIVQWVVQAWEDIQRMRGDWLFMRKEFSYALTISQARYLPTNLGITDFGEWAQPVDGVSPYKVYDPAQGVRDETRVPVRPYRHWQNLYDIQSAEDNRPGLIAFDWQRRLCLGPAPDKAYVFSGEYRRAIQTLAADTDEPDMPADYHKAIVWLAISYLGEHDEAPVAMPSGQTRFRSVYGAMVRNCIEAIELS